MSISAISSVPSSVVHGAGRLASSKAFMLTLLATTILSAIPRVKSGMGAYIACVATCMSTYMAAVGIQTYGVGYEYAASLCHNTFAFLLASPTP